jgi:hypothetical protein
MKLHRIVHWRISSAGRAPALQAGGRRFEPVILHHFISNIQLNLSLFGGVAKWLNAADCKSAPSGFGGSNPSPSTIYLLAHSQAVRQRVLVP